MANHCLTEIRSAIKYGLSTIIAGSTSGNGYIYKRSIRHIATPIKDPENVPELDAVDLFMDDEQCNNQNIGSHTQSGANKAILENSFEFTLVNFMEEANDIELAQENKLADLQAYFGQYYYIPSSSGVRTVFNCIYTGSRKFGYQATRPNCGIEVKFRVWYRQKLEDPTALA